MRFEDAGIDEITDEAEESPKTQLNGDINGKKDEVSADGSIVEANTRSTKKEDEEVAPEGVIRTLDGDEAGDEFAQDAINYQILLGKIDTLLETLDLDA